MKDHRNSIQDTGFLRFDTNLFNALTSYDYPSKEKLHEYFQRFRNSIVIINKIILERDIHINIERTQNNYHADSRSIFIGNLENKNQLFYIRILTEAYFTYVKNLFDQCSLILTLLHDLKENDNFNDLYEKIQTNQISKHNDIFDYMKNKMRWYRAYVSIPRNKGIIHDVTSTYEAYADHYFDYMYTRTYDHQWTDDEKKFLSDMYEKHKVILEEKYMEDYPIRTVRSILRYVEVLSDEDLKKMNNILKNKPLLPYLFDINSRIDDFLEIFYKHLNGILPNPRTVRESKPDVNWGDYDK